MQKLPTDYVQLNVNTSGPYIRKWFRVRRDIAEHYGWAAAYGIAGEPDESTPRPLVLMRTNARAFRPDIGGRKIRISRSPRRDKYEAGLVNQFRISRHCNNTDLRELAQLTQGEWHWMQTACGQVWTREQWLA